jgi:hypothetical protein
MAPEIPEWRDLYLAPDEAADTIRASVLRLGAMKDVREDRIGITGFSLGVPQVLLATTDPALRGRLRAAAGFGGYGNLDRTIRFLFRGEHEWRGEVHHMEPDPYGRWIVGGNYLTMIPGLEDAGDVAEALLNLARQAGDMQVGAWDACHDSVKEKLEEGIHPSRRGLFRVFAPPAGHRPAGVESEELIPLLAEAARTAVPLSEPVTFLDRIPVPVRLVHGRGDRLIPFSESVRVGEEFPESADSRVYLTGLFSHSQLDQDSGSKPGLGEQLNFLRILSDLLSLV